MTLSDKSIEGFRKHPQMSVINYLNALQSLQNATFQLEKEEKDPVLLKEFASRALDIGREIESVLRFLEKIFED